jgi:CRP-like cAMP-binding protein
MSREEWLAIGPKLSMVNLRKGMMLHESGAPIAFGTFVNTGMVSILSILNDGRAVDIGLVGKEGFVGMPLIAGFRSSLSRAIAQVEGTAFSIAAEALPAILNRAPQLQLALLRYSLVLELQMRQAAACNRLHEVHERLARWLLMAQDRLKNNSIPLTQEFLAQMLGIRRPSVSLAASVLQRAGVIRYARGTVTILNRPRLEQAACECYGAVLQQAAAWLLDIRKLSKVPD